MADDKTKANRIHDAGGEPDIRDHQFDSGAKRSAVMPFYAAIPYMSLRRLALRATGAPRGEILHDDETGLDYEGGSRKYGYHNWARGLPLEDTVNHVIEHLLKWKTAVRGGHIAPEDHLAAAAWGIMLPLMTFEADYASQATQRAALDTDGRTVGGIDAEMRRLHQHGRGYLLQPLAPEFPSNKMGVRFLKEYDIVPDPNPLRMDWPLAPDEPSTVAAPVEAEVQSDLGLAAWLNCACMKPLRGGPLRPGHTVRDDFPHWSIDMGCPDCGGTGHRER